MASLIKSSELTGFVNKVLKQVGVRRKDENVKYFCPFCNHYKRKLEIQMTEPYVFHCWTCNTKGRGIYWLLKKLNASSSDFSELEKIVGKTETKTWEQAQNIIQLDFTKDEKEELPQLEFPGAFKSLFEDDGSFSYKRAKNYADKRKLTREDIIKYNIGYCDEGLYKDRLIFPSYDANNRLNFFSCRSYYDNVPMKYMNSEVSKNIVGFENLVDFDYPISLCEGAPDAISLKRNAIPLFGKTLSHKLKTAISTGKCEEVNIVLDNDALKSAIDIAEYLLSFGKRVRLVQLQGKDPNEIGFQKTMECIKNTQFLDFAKLTMIRLGI